VLESNLIAMFPAPMQGKFKAHIQGHQLRRELVATDLANRIVNRLGLIHAFELPEEEGVSLSDVAAGFVVVERLYDLKDLWADIDAAPMTETARLTLLDRLAAAVGNLMSDVLRTTGGRVEAGVMVEALQPGVLILRDQRAALLQGSTRDRSQALRADFIEAGAPSDLAGRVADLFDFDGSVGIASLALQTKIEPATLTHAFADIGTRIGIDWAQGVAAHMSPSDVWERLLVDGLARDFQHMRIEFLRRVTARKAGKKDPQSAIAKWAEANAPAITQFRSMLARAQNSPPVAPAALAQIAAQARNLLER
jgi:glutamate dehydrogenase